MHSPAPAVTAQKFDERFFWKRFLKQDCFMVGLLYVTLAGRKSVLVENEILSPRIVFQPDLRVSPLT
jgi:hypothetical protein